MFNVLSIGKSHWKKGYDYALDAFKLLKEQNVKFTYTIIGSINLELKYQIEELGLVSNVLVIEQLSLNKLQQVLKTSNLVLISSVKEETNNLALQAMAAQKLVLTTNYEGIEDVIINGENGFIIPTRDVEAMAEKMLEISKMSEEQKTKITKKAQKTTQKLLMEEQQNSNMLQLHQSL